MSKSIIDHISFSVPNMQEAIDFYASLGFGLTGRYSGDGMEFVFISDGVTTYELLENNILGKTVIDHVAYVSQDIKADFERYAAQGLTTTKLGAVDFLFENGVQYFFIKGAGGEKIEFCQRC